MREETSGPDGPSSRPDERRRSRQTSVRRPVPRTHNWGRSVDDGNVPVTLDSALADGANGSGFAVRGNHRNYSDGASCTNGTVVTAQSRELRLLTDGTVLAGGAVTLDQLDRFGARHDRRVAVVPGTFHVTVGGAIAGDVHGKNHPLAGSFHTQVHAVHLRTFDGARHRVDRDHPWFPAVSSAMGLTGVIELAELHLADGHQGVAHVHTTLATGLGAGMRQLSASDHSHGYLRVCPVTRRAVVLEADLTPGNCRPALRFEPHRRIPPLPHRLVRQLERRQLQMLVTRGRGRFERRVDARDYLAPLDRFGRWDVLVGERGFTQYQYAIPLGGEDAIEAIAQRALDRGGYFLTVRRLGGSGPGWLSFPLPGWAISVDHAGDPTLERDLDRIAVEVGGRCNLSKNRHTSRETLEAMYPAVANLRTLLAEIDPHRSLRSGLARRLGLIR